MEVIERRDSVVSGAKAWRIGGDFVFTTKYDVIWCDIICYYDIIYYCGILKLYAFCVRFLQYEIS